MPTFFGPTVKILNVPAAFISLERDTSLTTSKDFLY